MVEMTVVFREGTTNAKEVMSQFDQHKEEGSKYNLNISRIMGEATSPTTAQPHEGSPLPPVLLFLLVLAGGGLPPFGDFLDRCFSF